MSKCKIELRWKKEVIHSDNDIFERKDNMVNLGEDEYGNSIIGILQRREIHCDTNIVSVTPWEDILTEYGE